MQLPEGYLPRAGDVLVLHGTVRFDVVEKEDRESDGLKVFIRLNGDFSDRRVLLNTVIGIHSRKWEAGERVRLIGEVNDDAFEVLAVHGQWVWCMDEDSEGLATYSANDLEPAPDAMIQPAPPPRAIPD